MQEKLKSMLRRWAEGDFKGDPQLALIPSLYNQLQKEGIDFSNTSSSGEVSIIFTIKGINGYSVFSPQHSDSFFIMNLLTFTA